MRRSLGLFAAVAIMFCCASAARAQDAVLDTIQHYLDKTSDYLDNNRIMGKIRFSPEVSQRFLYDDNIFLNDAHEPDTRGRVSDFITDSTVDLKFILPVNKSYTQLFKRDHLTLLDYRVRFLNYIRNPGVSSINQTVNSDLFGFLNDLANIGIQGKNIYFDAGAKWSDVSEPIDILVRDLSLAGFPSEFVISELRRTEIDAHATAGYRANHFDASVGYKFQYLDFNKDFFRQANLNSNTAFVQVGMDPPWVADQHVYLRYTYRKIIFRDHLLNNAETHRIVLGASGPILIRKLQYEAEAGYLAWNRQKSGLLADGKSFHGAVGLVRVAYKPFEARKLQFQLEASRDVNWSAISNYRVDHVISLTARDELLPKKLDGDVTISWSHHVPSEGPTRTFVEMGAGVTYHLFRQVDVSLRYLYRVQTSTRDATLTSFTPGGKRVTITTDGDFNQNVVSLGFDVKF